MKHIPSYGKILTLGSAYTEAALDGEIIIQEKVDGSQFRFLLNEEGELMVSSKSVPLILDAPPKMFALGVEYLKTIIDRLPKDVVFYGEYLEKPKHNTLKYDHTPKNNIVIFDALEGGKFADRARLEYFAELLGVDVIPELFKGEADVERIKSLLETDSYLGNEIIEGVVIKNYTQTIMLGGQLFPLFTKFVREGFKERHTTDWKIREPKTTLADYVNGFKNDNRWEKAFQFLRDKNDLEISPRDIPKLIKRVQEDIKEEESENIKNYLFKCFMEDIMRTSIKGLPEWYKEKLLDRLNW